ncbi:site-specific integrase [Flavobacterium psychrophilum]|uniref:site-specific integrase n=2 Tax=Flavobacterium psychrophilum TaxID=96345 RepID=UPI000B7C12E3|nr:site-specific integrase [Flavobacterium psychrophilum]EKT4499953.1 site-specific integrase [Flavobacterium psychrophilum]ELY1979963.1 site-specific integrase [Flavobacterium psychrophilum]ELY1992767.1 site-specific integrase [Flavobacterium psychrophilum]MCB6088502.1 site-specific integrase [Flavobacterium psychrophilum]MEB3380001.1 site-specific integrase [Flavobacterium psychrophilum]
MKRKVSILFYAKRAKANVNGLVPIYTRITINGKRIELSSNRFVEISKWSTEAGKMKGNSEEARSINNHLDMLRIQIIDMQMELVHKKIPVTAETLKSKILGVDERERMLIPIYQNHNDKIEELIGNGYAYGTLERFKISLKHLQEFILWKYNVADISITKIDYAFVTEFEFYLRSVKKCNNNTAVKYVRNFRKIIKICLDNDWLDKNPCSRYEGKMKEVERDFLTEEELNRIYNKRFSSERLTLVKDIFIFSCYTGLAYVDVKGLKKDHIAIGIDGEKWIFKNRQKTDTKSKIPVLPIAQEIIQKYENHPRCLNEDSILPILTNQKMNAYLKEVGDLCDISKEITFHMARHTFATSVTLTNGVPIETVSKMLGHKNIQTTQHYAKILDKKVSEDMQILRTKFAVKSQEIDNELNLIKIN